MIKLNMIDRLVNYVDPIAGSRRIAARKVLDITARYEGARSKDGWQSVGTSANAEIGRGLRGLRNVSRDLGRNSPYYARMIEVFTAMLIGDGITPAALGDDVIAKKLMEMWSEWAETTACDATGQTNFYGLQTLAVGGMIESGEALIRKRSRRPQDGLPIPLQLQVLEADHLDEAREGPVKGGLGVDIQGVRFNAFGRIEGYHIFDYHPGDNTWSSQRGSRFVPADEIIHLFAKKRASQVRGVPRGHAIFNLLRDMDDYRDARSMKAKIEATLALFISSEKEEGPDGPAPLGELKPKTDDPKRRDVETIDPGSIYYGRPGETVSTINASSTGDGNAFHRAMAEEASVGFGTTYDQTTGDLSRANYSSLRAGGIVQKRIVSPIQKQQIIPIMCQPVWRWFVYAGSLNGNWKGVGHRSKWMPPAHEKVDPKKDTDADVIEVTNGFTSWEEKVQSRGKDPRKAEEDLIKEVARWRENGLIHPMDAKAGNPREVINESANDSTDKNTTKQT